MKTSLDNIKNILIVDDSKLIRSVVSNALSRSDINNIHIVVADSYGQAQEVLKNNNFHIAILDVHLPDAENGEVIDLLISKDVPVVVLTGGINDTTKNIILNKKIVEYITKNSPQSINYIVAATKRILKNYDTYVLIVDDSKLIRLKTRKSLESLHVNVIEASSSKEAIDIVENSKKYIPLILTDYEMPDVNGMELTMHFRQHFSKDKLAIIAISANSDPKVAINFLRYGANDFIKKPFTDEEFSARINSNLELVELFRQSKEMASKDFLTGLHNRRFFFESGKPIHNKAKRKSLNIGVAMLDIDFFKVINDTYGHDIGDIAIQKVSEILNTQLRHSDLISRFGGEEFCILMEDISLVDIEKKLELIRLAFQENVIKKDLISFSYTVSIGLAFGSYASLEDMVSASDIALYEAKESGRNKVIIHTQSD